MVFETDRLRVRRWRRSDADSIQAIYSDPDVVRWIDDGNPISLEETESWLAITASNYEQRGYGMFTLDRRDTGEIAGFMGIVHPKGQPDAEIKYAFRRALWGQGLASELVAATVAYAAEALSLRDVIATVAPENRASQRVLLKSGFQFVEERIDEHGAREFLYHKVF